MSVVVTGFEPFDGLARNVSADVLERLPRSIAGHDITTAVLPVDSARLPSALARLPGDVRLLLHLGLAQDRSVLSIERVGLNLLDFTRPDNAGNVIVDAEVVPGGPLALAARYPVRRVLDAWASAGLPGMSSTSAGTYLCNQALYWSLHQRPANTQVGFIHLPSEVSMSLHDQARAVVLALEAAL